jgi:hypothetical protein
MSQKVVPMLHVPDVSTTVDWYKSIGFKVSDIGDLSGEAGVGAPLLRKQRTHAQRGWQTEW